MLILEAEEQEYLSRSDDGGWIQTFLGNRVDLGGGPPDQIDIRDIAHSLARQCRFGGHVRGYFSVAQHSVHVSRLCDPQDALWGLLHDATEGYLIDLPRPIKQMLPEYKPMESRLMARIAYAFGLDGEMPESVKVADVTALATERRDLMNASKEGHRWAEDVELAVADAKIIKPLGPEDAEALFLDRFEELTGAKIPRTTRRGHSMFYQLLATIADLHDRKNNNYAQDGNPLSNLTGCTRIGLPPHVGVVVRLQDKWSRIEQLMQGKPDLVGESLEDTLMDNAVYSLLAIILLREGRSGQ